MCITMYIFKQVSHKYDKCCSKNRINLCKQTAFTIHWPSTAAVWKRRSDCSANDNNDDKMHPIWYSQLKTHNYNNKTKESERDSKNARSNVTAISYFVFVFVFFLLFILYFVVLLWFCLLLSLVFGKRCCGAHSQLIFAQPKAVHFHATLHVLFSSFRVLSLDCHHGYSSDFKITQSICFSSLLAIACLDAMCAGVRACAVPSVGDTHIRIP